jgi:hypothetical protein
VITKLDGRLDTKIFNQDVKVHERVIVMTLKIIKSIVNIVFLVEGKIPKIPM